MSRSILRFVVLIAILSTVALSSVFAQEKPATEKPATSGDFKLTPLEGEPRSIHPKDRTIRVETSFGTTDVKLDAVIKVTFHVQDGQPMADVELTDHSILKGKLLTTQLTDDKGEAISLAGIRELVPTNDIPKSWLALILGLITLSVMEIVLGIDNVIFIAIVAAKLPPEQQPRARKLGLLAALVSRLVLLASLSFLLGLTKPLFTLPDSLVIHDLESREVSVRDLILMVGGTFLIYKSVREMHDKLEHAKKTDAEKKEAPKATFTQVLVQIAVIDIVFSLDSVITAVGMVKELWVMVAAMTIAMGVMLVFSDFIAEFVEKHPTIKVLALSFLILIGVLLVVEGFGQHVDKRYIYFAMGFAFLVEVINLRVSRPASPPKAV